MRKIISTLSLSVLLAACSGGGGSSDASQPVSPNPTTNNQQPAKPAEKPTESKEQAKPEQPKAEEPKEQPKPEQPKVEEPKEQPKPEQPKVEEPTKPTEPTKEQKTVGQANGGETFSPDKANKDLDHAPIYFKETIRNKLGAVDNGRLVHENKEFGVQKISAQENPERNGDLYSAEQIVVKLEPNNERLSGDNYELKLLGSNGYYGYYTTINEAHDGTILNFVVGAEKESFSQDENNARIDKNLTATFKAQDGFVYALHSAPGIKKGDLEIRYVDGKASGEVVRNGEQLFNVTAENVNSIVFNPVKDVDGIKQGQKAIGDVKFIDENMMSKGQYISGIVENDAWMGVFAAEKQAK